MEDKYLILSFKNNFLVFNSTNKIVSPNNVINSNKIFHNMYIYTYKYFKNNKNDILLLINKVLVKNKIDKVYYEDNRLNTLVLKFIKVLNIKSLYIKNFKSLKIEDCNLILSNKYLKYINAYYIPSSILKKIINSGKQVNLNYVDAISDNFMVSQDTIDSDALYFKKVLHIKENYNYKENDIVEFLKLNINLKTIHLHNYNIDILKSIIKCLKKDNREEIIILLYNSTNIQPEIFKELKKINKDYNNELNGDIKIIYSKNFIMNNLFRQLTYNHIRFAFAIALYVLFIGFVFTELYEYSSRLNIDKLNYELYMSYASLTDVDGNPSIEIYDEEPSVIEPKPVVDKYKFDKSFEILNKKNSDTVGWLTVNNTKIDYPVVQGKDNDYYLKHDFYKNSTSVGWVFMDYRNNSKVLDDNTIIYGHKMKSGIMFGTLQNALQKSWYTNKENQIITFDLPDNEMKWQIISVYRTNYTTDYLATEFLNEDEFNEWINKILGRSVYNFKTEVKYGDKILSLSTCYGVSSSNQRMVVHAKLIRED